MPQIKVTKLHHRSSFCSRGLWRAEQRSGVKENTNRGFTRRNIESWELSFHRGYWAERLQLI